MYSDLELPQPYSYPLQKMRYVAAYLLAALGDNSPSKADVTKILESVGLDIDDDRLDKVSEFLVYKFPLGFFFFFMKEQILCVVGDIIVNWEY